MWNMKPGRNRRKQSLHTHYNRCISRISLVYRKIYFLMHSANTHTHTNFTASRYRLVFSKASCIGMRLSKQAIRSAPCTFESLLLVFPVHYFHLCHKICTDGAIVVLSGHLLCMCEEEAGKVMTLSLLAEDALMPLSTPHVSTFNGLQELLLKQAKAPKLPNGRKRCQRERRERPQACGPPSVFHDYYCWAGV